MCLFKNAVLLLDNVENETGCAAPKDVVIDDDGGDGLDSVNVTTDPDEVGVAGEEYKGLIDNPENLVCKLTFGCALKEIFFVGVGTAAWIMFACDDFCAAGGVEYPSPSGGDSAESSV